MVTQSPRCSSFRQNWAIKGQHGAVTMSFQLWPIHHLSPAFSLGQFLGLRSGLEIICTKISGTEAKISARYHNSQIGNKGNLHPVSDLRGFVPSFSLLRSVSSFVQKGSSHKWWLSFRFPSRAQRSCPPWWCITLAFPQLGLAKEHTPDARGLRGSVAQWEEKATLF